MKKYEQYHFWTSKAEDEFDMAEECLIEKMPMAAEQHYLWHWVYLFRAAEANWYPGCEEDRIRHEADEQLTFLWNKNELFERTKANLKAVIEATKSLEVGYAIMLCDRYIANNNLALLKMKEENGTTD